MFTFSADQMKRLEELIGDVPHKYAVPIIVFINTVIERQKAAINRIPASPEEK